MINQYDAAYEHSMHWQHISIYVLSKWPHDFREFVALLIPLPPNFRQFHESLAN